MSAQPGASILLAYGPPPAQAQGGGAIVLDSVAASSRRTIRSACVAPWAASRPSASRVAAPFAITTRRDAASRAPWQIAAPQHVETRNPWGVSAQADADIAAPWGAYAARPVTAAAAPWGVASTADRPAAAPWGSYAGRPAATASPSWRLSYRADDSLVVPWGRYQPAARDLIAVVNPARPRNPSWVLPWVRYGRLLDPGWGVAVPDGTPPTDPAGTVIVPVQEYYFVINTVTFVRADTGAPVAARQFSASIDSDSWTWSWSATLPASELGAVKSPALGEQFELIATLNGVPLRLVVERINRERRFGDGQVRVSGRGRAAWLADPFAPIETRSNTEARTARQLLEDALTINGVSIGWTVDWRITDWLIPAGAWSHQGTYKDAAKRIAEAGGAYVQGHDTEQTLIVLPYYPAAPWAWSSLTPDIELPEDVVEVEGIEWTDRSAYNAVYVTGGEKGGRSDRILRDGTAADRVAPEIVDPLATAPEMTLQRGRAALSNTGRQAHIALRLPVLPETGLITPGKLIRYIESGTPRVGLSRSIEVAHDFPQLWQTIKVETHELEPV